MYLVLNTQVNKVSGISTIPKAIIDIHGNVLKQSETWHFMSNRFCGVL